MGKLLALSAVPLLCGLAVLAQQPAPNFHPGAWEINSVTTMATGRTVASLTNVCAKEQADFWKRKQAGLLCNAPKVTPAQNGIRVRVVCHYNEDLLTSRIESDVIEKFSHDGDSFTATGTNKTNTVYAGHAPEVTSVHVQAEAHRTGPCK